MAKFRVGVHLLMRVAFQVGRGKAVRRKYPQNPPGSHAPAWEFILQRSVTAAFPRRSVGTIGWVVIFCDLPKLIKKRLPTLDGTSKRLNCQYG